MAILTASLPNVSIYILYPADVCRMRADMQVLTTSWTTGTILP